MAASPSRSQEIWSLDAATMDPVEIVFTTNCPSGTGDATIALNTRTLYIASESDTSLQRVFAVGKSVAVSLTRAWGQLRRRSDRETSRATLIRGQMKSDFSRPLSRGFSLIRHPRVSQLFRERSESQRAGISCRASTAWALSRLAINASSCDLSGSWTRAIAALARSRGLQHLAPSSQSARGMPLRSQIVLQCH